ncbi:ATP-dependent DNA helicase hus2/rqh1 [Metarhizium anisopliae]
MQDQVDHMKGLGIQAVAFNGGCSAEYKRQIMSTFDEPSPEHFIELLYVTPEMVSMNSAFNNAMQTLYQRGKFARLVIDEAHCVSQWGHDFRPDYKTIGQVRMRFPRVPFMALTATATQNVIVDIKHNLNMANCQVFSQSFNRPNLYYEVRTKKSHANATESIASLINAKYHDTTGIVYTLSRKQAEEVAQTLADGDGNNAQKERQMVMLNRVTAFCDNKSDCRRTEVLRYFGEDFVPSQCQKSCDNCRAGLVFEQQDFSEYAIAAIQVVHTQRRLTASQCADILLGKKSPAHEELVSGGQYGIAKGLKKHEVVRVIDRLSAEKAFHENNVVGNYGVAIQYLEVGSTAHLFLTGQRKLMLTIQVDDGNRSRTKSSAKRTTKKKGKEQDIQAMQSTYVSSPVERRKRRRKVERSDDEENFPTTSNGYANDGFVVSDNDMREDDDEEEEEAFEPLPRHRLAKAPAKPAGKKKAVPSGPPITSNKRVEDLPEIHQDLVGTFVTEARKVEEHIRNKKELRRPLFTERDLQEMAIHWTISLDRMSRIPGIDVDKVQEHGRKLLPILKRHHNMYREIMDAETPNDDDQQVVDLVSSDLEPDQAEEDVDSHYFQPKSRPEVEAFHSKLQDLSSQRQSQPKPKSSYSRGSGGGKKYFGGKKGPRKASAGGVPKRKGNSFGGRKASGSSTAWSTAGTSTGKRDGKLVKKSGGGIGLMPV